MAIERCFLGGGVVDVVGVKMDFVRTHVTTSHSMLPSLCGVIPATTDCNGPYVSQERGIDAMCCARCHMVRQQIYKEKGGFITNKLALEYFYCLISQESDAASACIVTTCGRPLLYVPPASSDLGSENAKGKLKKQFLLWKELHLVSIVEVDNIGYTHVGTPIVFPSQDCIRKEEFGGDDGVEIKTGVLTVVDMAKALESGKWMYLINYYDTLEKLYWIKEKMVVF